MRKKIGENNTSQLQAVTFADQSATFSSIKKNQNDNYDELISYKRLRKRRVKRSCYRMLMWLLVVLLVPVMVFFTVVIVSPNAGHSFFGYTLYIVTSDSMTPEIKVNDCILVKRVKSREDIKVGDDITFVRQSDGRTVTHRIIALVENASGEIEYITKGVHVSVADSGTVPFNNIVGKRVMTVGWIGQAIMFFRTPWGIAIFAILFAGLMAMLYVGLRMSNDIRAVGN